MYSIITYIFSFHDLDLWPLLLWLNVKKPQNLSDPHFFEDIFSVMHPIFLKFSTQVNSAILSNFVLYDFDLWPLQVRSNIKNLQNFSDYQFLLRYLLQYQSNLHEILHKGQHNSPFQLCFWWPWPLTFEKQVKLQKELRQFAYFIRSGVCPLALPSLPFPSFFFFPFPFPSFGTYSSLPCLRS